MGLVAASTTQQPFSLIMEYMDGGDLSKLIKSYPYGIPLNQIIMELSLDILSALSYIHSENWIHRDLKPANILLKREGNQLIAKISGLFCVVLCIVLCCRVVSCCVGQPLHQFIIT